MRSPFRARRLGAARDALAGLGVLWIVRLVRLLPPEAAVSLGGRLARRLSPILPANGIARENVSAAFPEKSEAERRAILQGSWDNLGRMAVEFLFLDHISRYDIEHAERGRIDSTTVIPFLERFAKVGGPALFFSAHLANWEILAAVAARHGLDLSVLFRPLNNPVLAERIDRARGASMGRRVGSSLGASSELASILERGGLVGILVDQRYRRGPAVSFFGRPARSNPTLAKLARRFDCPVYGARTVRLSDDRFRLDIVGPLDLPRDRDGRVDVEGATRAIAAIVEGWVREHPEQWLWQHRRWRP